MFPQVLACDVSGKPHDWINWKDAITAKVKGSISYELGADDILARGGISRMTGDRSSVQVSSIIFLKEHFKRTDKVVLTNSNLFRRDLHVCAYCGRVFREEKLSRDHVLPTSRGGKDVWSNVVTSCKPCNNLKDDMTPEEADMQLLYVPYAPTHAESLILRNRSILANQMEFLLTFVPEHSRLHLH